MVEVAIRTKVAEWLRDPLRLALLCIGLTFLGFANVAWTTWQLLQAEKLVDHTRDVTAASREFLQFFTDTETRQRGYIMTGDERFLEAYAEGRRRIDMPLRRLKVLTADNAEQQKLTSEAAKIGDAKLDEFDETMRLMRLGRREGALEIIKRGAGLQLMEDLRAKVTAIQLEEDRLLTLRGARAERLAAWLVGSTTLGLMFAGIAVWYFWQVFSSEQERLEAIVGERTRQLETEKARITVLLDDFHHRIGNSLSMVGAILGHHAASSHLPQVKEIMNSARQRLQAIGAAQRRLHFSAGDDLVDAKDYLKRILDDVTPLIDTARIKVSFTADPAMLSSREASSLAIIMSELVINAMKHAFPGAMEGTISVRLASGADALEFEIADDGVGIGEVPEGQAGIGSRIIDGLLRSFGGTLETKRGNGPSEQPGTSHLIRFRNAAKARANGHGDSAQSAAAT